MIGPFWIVALCKFGLYEFRSFWCGRMMYAALLKILLLNSLCHSGAREESQIRRLGGPKRPGFDLGGMKILEDVCRLRIASTNRAIQQTQCGPHREIRSTRRIWAVAEIHSFSG
jgi:hypothetical protein